MSPKRMFVVLAVVAAAMAAILAPAAQAAWNVGNCGSDTLVGNTVTGGVTLTVNGTTKSGAGADYGAQVCKSNQGLYNYMVGGLSGGTVIDETGTLADVGKTYVLSFALLGADVPKMVEGYGNISAFTISGQVVTITGTPGQLTQINYGGSSIYGACMSNPYSGTWSGGSCAAIPCWPTTTDCVDDIATFHGAVRLPGGGVDKTGMWISSASNLYAIGLNNCVTMGKQAAADGRRYRPVVRQDNGANRPTPDISVQMVGPHYKTDGSLNTGNIRAFIPFAVIQNCFGVDASTFQSGVGVTRQESGTDTALVAGTGFTLTPTTGGLLLTVPTVGFSSPTYKIAVPRAASSSTGTTTDGSTSSTGPRIAGVAWKGAKGKLTAKFAAATNVKSYAIKAALKGKTKSGSCVIKGTKVTCTVKRLAPGPWDVSISSKLKAGGAGPTASNSVAVH